MGVYGEGLTGTEPIIAAERVIDGGVWLWPLRGDMLRHPSTDTQVFVVLFTVVLLIWRGKCSLC